MSDKPADKKPTIYEAIPLITGAVQPIAKKKRNEQQNYNFRGVDDVYAMLNLILSDLGISIIPEVIENHHDSYTGKGGGAMFRSRLLVKYHLIASDKSELCATVAGEGMDPGDKATPKALSCAYKYMAFQVFCIPTGEKIDTEWDSPEVEAKPAAKSNGHPAPSASPAQADPSVKLCEQIRTRIKACGSVSDMVKLDTEIADAHKAHSINDKQKAWLGEIVSARLKDIKLTQEQAA